MIKATRCVGWHSVFIVIKCPQIKRRHAQQQKITNQFKSTRGHGQPIEIERFIYLGRQGGGCGLWFVDCGLRFVVGESECTCKLRAAGLTRATRRMDMDTWEYIGDVRMHVTCGIYVLHLHSALLKIPVHVRQARRLAQQSAVGWWQGGAGVQCAGSQRCPQPLVPLDGVKELVAHQGSQLAPAGDGGASAAQRAPRQGISQGRLEGAGVRSIATAEGQQSGRRRGGSKAILFFDLNMVTCHKNILHLFSVFCPEKRTQTWGAHVCVFPPRSHAVPTPESNGRKH